MFKIALVAFALIAASEAVVRSCDRGVTGPLPLEMRITGCPDNTATCRIIRGGTISGEMDFVTSKSLIKRRAVNTNFNVLIIAYQEVPSQPWHRKSQLTHSVLEPSTFCQKTEEPAAIGSCLLAHVALWATENFQLINFSCQSWKSIHWLLWTLKSDCSTRMASFKCVSSSNQKLSLVKWPENEIK